MKGRKPYATKEQLEQDYLVDRLPLKEIAERYGFSKRTSHVSRAIRRYGIPMRSRRGLAHNYHRPHQLEGQRLSHTQRQVVLGSLLGDGSLRNHHRYGGNSVFSVEHSIEHIEYVHWLAEQLGEFAGKIVNRDARPTKMVPVSNPSLMLYSINHPEFSVLRDRFYPNGKKIIPAGLLDELDALGIAVWIMDDGCYNDGKHNQRIQLSTQSFTLEEHQRMVAFWERWGVQAKIIKVSSGSGYATNFASKSTEQIRQLIQPYVPSSLLYKLGINASG